MLKVIGAVNGGYRLLNTTNWVIQLRSASDLATILSNGREIDNCELTKSGIRIYLGAGKPIEVKCKVKPQEPVIPDFENLPGEVWKPVTIHNEQVDDEHWLYEVSNMGRIRQYLGGGYRLRKQTYTGVAKFVRLSACGKDIVEQVAKVVATAFIANLNNYEFIWFLDNDETNCCADNLMWHECEWVKPEPKKPEVLCMPIDFELFLDENSRPIYEVLETGMVRMCADKSFVKMVKLNGVVKTTLRARDGKSHYVSLAGVVLTILRGRPNQAVGIIHINRNTDDCGLENLKWSKNADECDEIVPDLYAQFGSARKIAKPAPVVEVQPTVKVIRQYNLDGSPVADFKNEKKVQSKLGFPAKRIKEACLGTDHFAFGFLWEYIVK